MLSESFFHLSASGSNVGDGCDHSCYVATNQAEEPFLNNQNLEYSVGLAILNP
jgi:hypothetical protein